MWLFGWYVKGLYGFFTESNKINYGEVAESSVICKNNFGLLLPLYDMTVLLIISLLEGTEIY